MIKLVILTCSIFAGTWLAWVFLVHKNDQKRYAEPLHPFANLPFQVIAHRGGAGEAPENTFAAFDHALSLDPNIMFELDVQLTKDENVILMHDNMVDRTTDGKGHVADLTLAEIKKLDAGAKFNVGDTFPFKGTGIKVPTLKEILDRYPKTKILIDMKDNFIGKAEPIAEVVIQAHAGNRVIFGSDSPKMLLEVRRYIQPNPFGGLPMTGPITPEQMQKAAALPKESPLWMFAASKDEMTRTAFLDDLGLLGVDRMRADFLSIPEEHEERLLLTASLINEAHRRHKRIFVWTVNNEDDMRRLIERKVDGIITDFPSRLVKITGLRAK